MNDFDTYEDLDLKRTRLLLYLIPVFGFFPALWTLYRRKGSKQEQKVSRLAVILALGWLSSYVVLGTGVQTSESFALPLLVTNGVLTSGYFVVNLWLMTQVMRRKRPWLPVFSKLSDRLP